MKSDSEYEALVNSQIAHYLKAHRRERRFIVPSLQPFVFMVIDENKEPAYETNLNLSKDELLAILKAMTGTRYLMRKPITVMTTNSTIRD